MGKRQKILLIVIILALVLAIGLTTFIMINNKKSDNVEVEKQVRFSNDNAGVIKEQMVDGFKINNVMLIVKEGGSSFRADITNTTKEEIGEKTIEVIFKTSTGKRVTSLLGYYGKSIKPGETKSLMTSTSRKLNKNIVKSVEYKIK